MHPFIEKLLEKAKDDNVQKVSVGAVVVYNNAILMLKRRADDFKPNIYELPGGGLEGDETLLAALDRELQEETGCIVQEVVGYVGALDFKSATGLATRRFNFLVKPVVPFAITLSEHSEYIWLEPDDVEQYDISEQTKKIISLFHANKINYF